uniref:Uncharacterized protein n=1 Tax=Siphoviridae sp. ctvxh7 TaxID=2827283 RepID=A0A8S5R9B9_9CAUD|nr:MAG TPA: hypothetical protein [Siphoviridae sp. ctvxh7]
MGLNPNRIILFTVRYLSKPKDTPCLKARGVFFHLGDKGE